MYSLLDLKPVCCSMSSSNCCFLTCTQVSQKTVKVVWYSHLFKNFPQFLVIHTVKGFSIVNEAEVDVIFGIPLLFYDPTDVSNLISGSSAFSKSCLYIWKFLDQVLLKPAAAAKLLQSCLTLCDCIDSNPPGSPSLGFSRQEHCSGLPFPSPMHESEK